MCGHYVSPDDAAIEPEFNLVHHEWQFPPSFNVAPTQQVPVIRSVDGKRQGTRIRWVLIPFFAKGEPPKYSCINARIETVETAASGLYEWHLDHAGRKALYTIAHGNLFGPIAGSSFVAQALADQNPDSVFYNRSIDWSTGHVALAF